MKPHLFDNGLGLLLFGWVAYQWCAGSVLYCFRGRGDSLEMCHQWVDHEDHPVIFWIVQEQRKAESGKPEGHTLAMITVKDQVEGDLPHLCLRETI